MLAIISIWESEVWAIHFVLRHSAWQFLKFPKLFRWLPQGQLSCLSCFSDRWDTMCHVMDNVGATLLNPSNTNSCIIIEIYENVSSKFPVPFIGFLKLQLQKTCIHPINSNYHGSSSQQFCTPGTFQCKLTYQKSVLINICSF